MLVAERSDKFRRSSNNQKGILANYTLRIEIGILFSNIPMSTGQWFLVKGVE